MQTASVRTPATAAFRTHDPRLEPIAAKVLAGQRLSFDDGLALYGTGDVLAVGWLANHVRERMHGDMTYFNVNRHINPTNVCVAACKPLRLWPQKRAMPPATPWRSRKPSKPQPPATLRP
jgi:aminodeoxyfutalosine synthase